MIAAPLLVILGATASGKTKLAINLAQRLNGEIISADSRQLYRGMDIGTGKDLEDYQGTGVAHHLIDIRDAGETYHVDQFKRDFFDAFELVSEKKKLPILCGGSAMYIHSVLKDQPFTAVPINPELRQNLLPLNNDELVEILCQFPLEHRKQADLSSHKRLIRAIEIAAFLAENTLEVKEYPKLNPFVVGLVDEVEQRRSKIFMRLKRRLENGLIEEVEQLLSQGISVEQLRYYGLEYKYVTDFVVGLMDREALETRLGIAICQFAKRQMTFFRKMEKDGVVIHWIKAESDFKLQCDEVLGLTKQYFHYH